MAMSMPTKAPDELEQQLMYALPQEPWPFSCGSIASPQLDLVETK